MINYKTKKTEKKSLEEKMKIFENNYIIKTRGGQDINVYSQNDIIYVTPAENITIEELTIKENINANFIRSTREHVSLRIDDQIYNIRYEPIVLH
jgi:hypothetical protein